MKPFFLRDTKNFGDYSNHILWKKLIPELLDEHDGMRLIGVGSLLKSDLNYVQGKKVILGTGSGYGAFPPAEITRDWDFYFVRGPLTASKFNISKEKAVVDGAWLFALLSEYDLKPIKKGISFIPHWKSAEKGNWKGICELAQIKYIDPISDFDTILNCIAESELVITESLHGAIFADLYRTPWIPVKISNNFINFKWIDWCESVSVPFNLINIPPSSFLDCISEKTNPFEFNNQVNILKNCPAEDLKVNVTKTTPPSYYKQLMILKKFLRGNRENIFNKLQKLSKSYPIKNWDEKRANHIASFLITISKQPSYLSNDKIRNEKLDILNDIIAKLKLDYHNGKLHN